MNELRKEKFKRLATQRTNAVLEKLRLLGNLSNKANYEYSDEEVVKIFSAIESQFRSAKSLFLKGSKKEFKL
jgi:hypothetical protein